MAFEYERAYITGNVSTVRARLETMGYMLVERESQVNVYHDHPFLHLIEQKKYLRARLTENGNKAEISFSSPVLDVSTGIERRAQHSIKRAGRQSIESFLKSFTDLGFDTGLVLEKERELFSRGGLPDARSIHFEIDTGIVVRPGIIRDMMSRAHRVVTLEDTVQICIESDGNEDLSSLKERMDAIAIEIGLAASAMMPDNYFERYFKKIENNNEGA